MLNYKDLPFWINRIRRNYLLEFRIQCKAYFESTRIDDFGFIHEDDKIKELRRRINSKLILAHKYMISAEISPNYGVLPSPTVSTAGNYDLLHHIFELRQAGTTQHLLDILDRALGVYDSDYTSSIIRTFNPFHWIKLFLLWLMNFPITVLRRIGFSIADNSFWAALIRVLTLLGSVITAINKSLDLIKPLRDILLK